MIEILTAGKEALEKAVQLIKKGELVAFPTETVYGLGANALDEKAVRKIFEVKGRPNDNPLIVHIADFCDLDKVAVVSGIVKKRAERLKKFWPGPLTVVLPKNGIVPNIVTAGLESVAIRIPDSKFALELIRKSGVPISAPSANLSGKPSPTNALDVFQDMAGKIELIVDGGNCKIGVESTVVDLTSDKVEILRPGKITLEELKEALGEEVVVREYKPGEKLRSPGMKYRHYAPNAKLIVVQGEKKKVRARIKRMIKENNKLGIKTERIIFDSAKDGMKTFFFKLRKFDNFGVKVILAEDVSCEGEWMALSNRLRRAASEIIVV